MKRALAWLVPALLLGQGAVLQVGSVPQVSVKRGAVVTIELPAQLKSGYHVNSNKPSDEFLIPLKLTWDAGPLDVVDVSYPQPKFEKYAFADKPISVFSGDFKIATRFKAKPSAAAGPAVISGKLRYQACTDRECFPPKSVPVSVAVNLQ